MWEANFIFLRQIHFVKSFVFNFCIVLQNLFIAEVTGEVLELAVEERIQPDGRHALVPSETGWSGQDFPEEKPLSNLTL